MESVLIVEDNPAMLRGLQDNFRLKGYRVKTATDGEQGLNTALLERPDLIVLDIMLPKINGYEVCSHIRGKNLNMPIIMVTAKSEDADRILGLDIGADNYITKPFSIKVLLAQARALLRRTRTREPSVYEFGDCRFNIAEQTLERNGKAVKLTPGELKLLRLFLKSAGRVLTCEEILHDVWGYSHFISLRDVEGFIKSLRNKIEPDPENPTFIKEANKNSYKFQL